MPQIHIADPDGLILYDWETEKPIRQATREEERLSIESEHEHHQNGGVITIDGRLCFVYMGKI